jgi:hypothetical protein
MDPVKLRLCGSGAMWFKLGRVLVLVGMVCLLCGCIQLVALLRPRSPVLHEADCDLSPVLGLKLPERIETLARVPRDMTVVENGIIVDEGTRDGEGMKEFFFLRQSDGRTEYMFAVFFTEEAAIAWYEAEKKAYRVFRECNVDGCSGCVHYSQEPRSDPEGGSSPMGYCASRASFRLRNAVILVTVWRDTLKSEKLPKAVKELGQMLRAAFEGKQ